MCNFWSCIVTKNGEVLFDEMSDRHEDIIEKYKLVDDTADPALLKFARVEINPPNGDVFAHINDWVFKIDQSIIPTWFTKENEKSCYKKLKYFTKKAILIGKEIKEISSGRFWVKDCKIVETKGTALICEMRGTSKVGVMRGTSQVGVMRETSQVGVMRETSKVGVMLETSQVGVMWGTSKVGEMWGTSKVGAMRGTSKVGEMRETSKVGVMLETSQVGEMWGTSKVGEMWGTSQVGVFSKNSIFYCKENAIAIIYFEQSPKIIVANKNIKIEYQKDAQ